MGDVATRPVGFAVAADVERGIITLTGGPEPRKTCEIPGASVGDLQQLLDAAEGLVGAPAVETVGTIGSLVAWRERGGAEAITVHAGRGVVTLEGAGGLLIDVPASKLADLHANLRKAAVALNL